MLSFLYREVLFRPILNALFLLYTALPLKDLGIAIIILTFLIRLLLLPFTYKGIKAQKELAKIQPKLKEIQRKYKDNREEQARQLMELYRVHKISPFSAIIPLFVQLPIIIALYRVFIMVIKQKEVVGLYNFVSAPSTLNPYFLGVINLGQQSVSLAIIAGVIQFIYSKMTVAKAQKKQSQKDKKPGFSNLMGTQMTYFMPILIAFFGMSLPAGLPLYWIATTLFGIGEQLLIKKKREPSQEISQKKQKEKRQKASSQEQK